MALEFLFRPSGNPRVSALFPGAWNPPTVAHLEIARAARKLADEVVWVLPRRLSSQRFRSHWHRCPRPNARPHRPQRAAGSPLALSDGGLYVDIADRGAAVLRPGSRNRARLRPRRSRKNRHLGLRQARRLRCHAQPASPSGRGPRRRLSAAPAAPRKNCSPSRRLSLDQISSSDIRRRIAAGVPWSQLVPAAIASLVEDLYA